MGYTDRFHDELSQYLPPLTRQSDFDAFWQETLAQSAAMPLNPRAEPVCYPGLAAKVYDIVYDGFGGTPIHGWFLVPAFVENAKYPCLIHYHGFTGSRGTPSEFMQWISLGAAVLSVDVRGQCGSTGEIGRAHV